MCQSHCLPYLLPCPIEVPWLGELHQCFPAPCPPSVLWQLLSFLCSCISCLEQGLKQQQFCPCGVPVGCMAVCKLLCDLAGWLAQSHTAWSSIKNKGWDFLVDQWLRHCTSPAEGTGSLPGRGTGILQAVGCDQKAEKKKTRVGSTLVGEEPWEPCCRFWLLWSGGWEKRAWFDIWKPLNFITKAILTSGLAVGKMLSGHPVSGFSLWKYFPWNTRPSSLN